MYHCHASESPTSMNVVLVVGSMWVLTFASDAMKMLPLLLVSLLSDNDVLSKNPKNVPVSHT